MRSLSKQNRGGACPQGQGSFEEKILQIGDIRIGKKWHKYIWASCQECDRERWVGMSKGLPVSPRCRSCSTRANNFARETRGKKAKQGYMLVKLQPDDFFYPMAWCDGYVFEHRLVMAKYLKRCLQVWEIIHHKNGVKDDNRIENLQLMSEAKHYQFTRLIKRIESLEGRVVLLEAENELLKEWAACPQGHDIRPLSDCGASLTGSLAEMYRRFIWLLAMRY